MGSWEDSLTSFSGRGQLRRIPTDSREDSSPPSVTGGGHRDLQVSALLNSTRKCRTCEISGYEHKECKVKRHRFKCLCWGFDNTYNHLHCPSAKILNHFLDLSSISLMYGIGQQPASVNMPPPSNV